MKHNPKITAILIGMFFITQIIGLYVVNYYSPVKVVGGTQINVTAPSLPFGLEPPKVEKQTDFLTVYLPVIIMAFIIAISLLFLLSRFKVAFLLKIWFFIVVTLALVIFFKIFLSDFRYPEIFALIIALPLAFMKIYRRNLLVHNFTELLIYPGIAAVFVPLLNIYTIIVLLVLISAYDIWAVWHSGIMQKMAKYQINKLKIFSGFFVPYISKKMKAKIKEMKKTKKAELRKKKVRVNVAILGGGDIIFPIITAGVVLKEFGFTVLGNFQIPIASILVILGAALGLGFLFLSSEKKKFYPAMPFISVGIFLGIGLSYLLLRIL